jgi:hypothetical protein
MVHTVTIGLKGLRYANLIMHFLWLFDVKRDEITIKLADGGENGVWTDGRTGGI